MNTKQIAEEAALKAARKMFGDNFDDELLDGPVAELTPIIQAAIEKATETYRDNEDKICDLIEETKITEPEGSVIGRVASLCSWAKLHKSRAAHASEPKFGQEPTLVPIEHCILEVDSPCFPAGWDEYLQCGCHRCLEYIRRYILSLEKGLPVITHETAHASEEK